LGTAAFVGGGVIGNLVGGLIIDHLGLPVMLIMCAACSLCAVVISQLALRRSKIRGLISNSNPEKALNQ
jgi:predicted MFS family arabinose efflux permease